MQEHADEDERQWERWCPNAARQVGCNYLKSHEYKNGLRMVSYDDSLKNTLPIPDDETAEELERIAEVLRKLDADDYRIVELYTADIPHAQMAQRLGISLRKLQYRIREVKLRIKKISKELY
jgi:DNA-directed RNA polymerase specialized sigma24 family protein